MALWGTQLIMNDTEMHYFTNKRYIAFARARLMLAEIDMPAETLYIF
jgi:hypothetical protein